MKNRKIPYGYEMKNGAVVINSAEAKTVKNIFSEYVNGLVLKDIAATLKAQGAEYLPGETDWNKSRVKRIIDDARYCGNEKYPEIIPAELYSAAAGIKQKRNRAKEYTVRNEDKPVTDSVRCSLCGGKLRHITERMKAELINTAPLSEFSGEIFRRTVKATVMEKDGTVRLTLKNGTVLGKGDS